MKIFYTLLIGLSLLACSQQDVKKSNELPKQSPIIGTWKMVYGDIKENDSVQVKDLSQSEFIKIINETHFAFFNQEPDTIANFYGGAGTYTLNGNQYEETLNYLGVKELRGHKFPFTVEFKGDTLIQYGLEDVPEAGIKRHITEKYIRIK